MTRLLWTYAAVALIGIGNAPLGHAARQQAPPPGEGIYWYYDADTALEVARKTSRPLFVLKIRADIGEKPAT